MKCPVCRMPATEITSEADTHRSYVCPSNSCSYAGNVFMGRPRERRNSETWATVMLLQEAHEEGRLTILDHGPGSSDRAAWITLRIDPPAQARTRGGPADPPSCSREGSD